MSLWYLWFLLNLGFEIRKHSLVNIVLKKKVIHSKTKVKPRVDSSRWYLLASKVETWSDTDDIGLFSLNSLQQEDMDVSENSVPLNPNYGFINGGLYMGLSENRVYSQL